MTKKPSYRFAGYIEPWEEKKLGEVSTSFSGGTPAAGNKKYYGGEIPFIRSAEINSDKTELFLTKEGLDNSSAKLVKKGDILYALYGATSGEVGISKINGAINQAILSIIPKTNYTSEFIMQWLRLQKKNIIDKYLQGGQGNLSGSIVKELGISLPSLPEQTAIGSFFQDIDQLISLQQRKLEVLKEQKKTYLKLLFPAKGQTKPALRFAGFEDEWKEVKLGEVTDRYDNLRVPVSANERVSGDTPYYGANGIQDYVDGYTHDGEFILIAEDGASDLKDYPVQYVNGKVWVNNHAHVIQGKKDLINNIFLLFAVKQINIEPFLVGGGRAKLNSDIMMKLPLHLPNLPEQEAIGSFFQDLDKSIAKQDEKVNQLKESKQTLLRKMFI
ncbi:restriction endonuclease subunit S [Streptococcus mitis]|uniref:restriction endonuclease subunit S n=1 Tax=Streptococcus mitis TaxID=28037 RepID=UPI0021B64E02|nr:restriction endonuclease subunit S [Streptococcus mitis]